MHTTLKLAAAVAAIALSGAAYADADSVIAANKCGTCHTAKTTPKGPSWASIAEKFKGKPDAQATLVKVLKTGQTPDGEEHKKIEASDADLEAVVAKVLAAK
jgi:cytochrome c